MFGADFGVGQVVWSFVWFFLFFVWIMLLFRVFGDLFRSTDMRGVTKVLWVLFVIVLPYLGVFLYLITRGDKMAAREANEARAYEDSVRQYIRESAGTSASAADELERLASLRDRGVIDETEFGRLKAKVLG
ncbi:SHOCT domain-containing protein [Desertimonas flava]|uniref:SHOCT domain-containing protein n=1 Tax=Desertimonas flava TaxID=2064846 RepID=UPI001D0C15CF|nr:SHOCT domain-containing protein [Desertimonas flava]